MVKDVCTHALKFRISIAALPRGKVLPKKAPFSNLSGKFVLHGLVVTESTISYITPLN